MFTTHEQSTNQEIYVDIPVSRTQNPEKNQLGMKGSKVRSPRKLESYHPADDHRVIWGENSNATTAFDHFQWGQLEPRFSVNDYNEYGMFYNLNRHLESVRREHL
jgi:hypothetical protein